MVKWIFAAEDLGVGTEWPVIRFYRGGENLYNFSSLQGSDAVSTTSPNVYELIVDPPTPIYAGDFIALDLPPVNSVRLLLSFILNDDPPGESIEGDSEFVEGLPLITLEIGMVYIIMLTVWLRVSLLFIQQARHKHLMHL